MGINQCHEHQNKLVKGDVGASGLIEGQNILRK